MSRYTHNLLTYSNNTYPMTLDDKKKVDVAMEEGKTFVRFGSVSKDGLPKYNVAIKNISDMKPIPATEADFAPDNRALPRGEIKFDPNGPGYKSFLEAKKKLLKKMGVNNVTN